MTDLKREDVARVLADAAAEFEAANLTEFTRGLYRGVVAVAYRLGLKQEFESALKALEKEQK